MSSDRDFETTTAEWLNAGSDTTPPHLIDAVLLAARTHAAGTGFSSPVEDAHHEQVRHLRLRAAAMVVIAFLIAAQLFGSPGNVGSGGEPTPSPEATATESSSSPSVAWGSALSSRPAPTARRSGPSR